MKKLLNIDGGGVRVYLPLLILNYIEKKTNKRILDLFDYFSGVSASSIILSGLLIEHNVESLIKIFKELAPKIFYKSYYYSLSSTFGMTNSKYPDYYINQELEKIFGTKKISELSKPFTILSYDLNKIKPIQFHSHKKHHHSEHIMGSSELNQDVQHLEHKDYELWKIIRASTAAPTYFPPMQLDNLLLVDGGVVVNNLSELIFINALEQWGAHQDYYQLSLGSGFFNKKHDGKLLGIISWSTKILDVLFAASSAYETMATKKLSKIQNLKQFHRINIELDKDIGLDDYTTFGLMDKIFESWLANNKELLDKICDELLV